MNVTTLGHDLEELTGPGREVTVMQTVPVVSGAECFPRNKQAELFRQRKDPARRSENKRIAGFKDPATPLHFIYRGCSHEADVSLRQTRHSDPGEKDLT